jgi:hypothetical protein
MGVRTLVTLLVACCGLVACGPDGEPTKGATTSRPEPAAASVAGMYEIEGSTADQGGGREREITGTILLAEEGARYRASFNLETEYPSREGPVRADVIGKGDGTIEQGELVGQAETQLVMATVPGVDTKFAFVPRLLGPRIVSTTVGRFTEDGTLVIEIRSEGLPGEEYVPTRTVLRGKRVPPEQLGAPARVGAAPEAAVDR